MKITNGLILAGYDSVIASYEKISKNYNKDNKLLLEMRPGLTCYGAEIVKKTLPKNGKQLHETVTKKFLNLYDNYHVEDVPWYIDSGGYQVCRGYVPPSYCEYLSDYYTQFIELCCNDNKYNDMLFFYLDLITTNGITKDFSIFQMKNFQKLLMDRTKNNKGHERVHLIIQVNNEVVYDTFYHFIRDNSIHEQLNSHKWAVGGLVVIDFNDPQYDVRPYMPAIFDCLDLELSTLKNNISVYFHILGTSSYYEMFLISWMNILCEYYQIPFIITFDSTTHINNSTRSGVIHYIDENNDIIKLQTKYQFKDNIINNNFTNYYYMNKVKEFLFNNIDIVEDFDWYDDKNRWSKLGANALSFYEAWAFGKVFDYIKNKCNEKKDLIIYEKNRWRLKSLIIDIMSKIDDNFISGASRKSFDSHILGRLIKSLDWFELALKNKLPNQNKSYHLIKRMFHTNTNLMTNNLYKIDSIDKII